VHINQIEELRENLNSNSKYFAFIIEVQKINSNNGKFIYFRNLIKYFLIDNDEEKPHWIVAR
jgi:hypothetical protein